MPILIFSRHVARKSGFGLLDLLQRTIGISLNRILRLVWVESEVLIGDLLGYRREHLLVRVVYRNERHLATLLSDSAFDTISARLSYSGIVVLLLISLSLVELVVYSFTSRVGLTLIRNLVS